MYYFSNIRSGENYVEEINDLLAFIYLLPKFLIKGEVTN